LLLIRRLVLVAVGRGLVLRFVLLRLILRGVLRLRCLVLLLLRVLGLCVPGLVRRRGLHRGRGLHWWRRLHRRDRLDRRDGLNRLDRLRRRRRWRGILPDRLVVPRVGRPGRAVLGHHLPPCRSE